MRINPQQFSQAANSVNFGGNIRHAGETAVKVGGAIIATNPELLPAVGAVVLAGAVGYGAGKLIDTGICKLKDFVDGL